MLALVVAAALVLAIGLAAVGAFSRGGHTATPTGRPSASVSSTRNGDVAWVTAKAFARSIHPRPANSWGEIRARAFIFGDLQQYGYYPRTQEFIAGSGAREVHSANIIVVKQGATDRQLIVGAHYDSARLGEGYIDNATGLGLLLEMAARMRQRSSPYTIVFVAFGASQSGLAGSRYYVQTMTPLERRATVGMIDLDGVAGGARLTVASRPGGATWLRGDALSGAQSLHLPLALSPAGAGVPQGVVRAPSDDLPFALAGMPTALLTSLDWRAVYGTGRPRLTAAPRLSFARTDVTAHVEEDYPGRVRGQLRAASLLLEILLTAKLETHP